MAITKGPWTAGSYDKEVVFGRDGDEVAVASFRYGESEDNARLIAAAPDMYEALECFLIECENWPDGESTCVDMARAAITRARGE